MQTTDNVLQLAKERALFGFTAIVQQGLFDMEARIEQMLPEVRSGAEQYELSTSRQFIHNSGKAFLKRVEERYRGLLERATETMYKDWRVDINKISMSNLSLVDDEAVQTLIEVDRLVLRIRDADDIHLKRLNLIVAQMHGKHDAVERENPFRPYLMARSLLDVLRQMVSEEEVSQKLYTLLSEVLAARLADFYATLVEVFESNGMHGQLMAQRHRHARSRHEFEGEAEALRYAAEVNARIMPGLQRMFESMNAGPAPQGGGAGPAGGAGGTGGGSAAAGDAQGSLFPDAPTLPEGGFGGSEHTAGGRAQGGTAAPRGEDGPAAHSFERVMEGIFRPPAQAQGWPAISQDIQALGLQPAEAPAHAPGSPQLMQMLDQAQRRVARGESIAEGVAPEQNQLFALSQQLAQKLTQLERIAIDVVGMLFELILADKSIPPELRRQIGRLQVPFLKAALMAPDMLRQADHPARQLVNRMGSAAVAIDPETPAGKSIEGEITRIADRVLAEFIDNIDVFSDCLIELERFLVEDLPKTDATVSSSAEVLEQVEQSEAPAQAPLLVPPWLAVFRIDQRVVEFIVRIWLPVLEVEHLQHVDEDNFIGVYRELLPDLIWSAQEKRSNEERAALMNMLPRLARSLKAGMSLLQMPEQEAREALDQLMPVHAQLLRPNVTVGAFPQMSLDEMRHHFSLLTIGAETQAPIAAETEKFEAELARRHMEIELDLEREETPTFESDADWLIHMQVGTCVERWTDAGYKLARLNWISKRKTLYMFMLEDKTLPVVYSASSLIKALREGSVCLMESAPVFERAVETLLSGARSMGAGAEAAP
ncbi:MAG TPA: DUF1631 family protein [Burkholderiaceae bacterium]